MDRAGSASRDRGPFSALRAVKERVLDPVEICERFSADPMAPQLGVGPLNRLERDLRQALAPPRDDLHLVRISRTLAEEHLRHGNAERSVTLLTKTLAIVKAKELRGELDTTEKALGIALLRSGETQHCLQSHNSDSCLFPINEHGRWPDTSFSHAAIEHFESYLSRHPNDPAVRWLNNIAHMTAGIYSEIVESDAALPEVALDSVDRVLAFRDVAELVGLGKERELAGGAIVDDFDGDGRLDVVVSSKELCTPLSYFHNDGEAGFSDWTERAGLLDQLGGLSINQTDYDNDGRLDILVLRGAWGREWGRQRNSLLRQNADGSFTDVTRAAGLAKTAYPTLSAAWADYDLDGDLDLFVPNEIINANTFSPSELFRNEGDGTFKELAKAAGVVNSANGKAATWGDYDNDGDPDLFVANYGQPNRLYRNDGKDRFVDVAPALGVHETKPFDKSFVSWFWDVNNDGWLDLFVGGFGARGLNDVAADYFGEARGGERLRLFINDGKGGFVDRTEAFGLDVVRMPMGANFEDFDNDGWLDFYLGTGSPPFEMLVPNILFKNIAGERFEDVTNSARVGHLQKGHGVAFGDLDGDGDQDLFAQMGGRYPADGFTNALFENPGSTNAWVELRFVGVDANRAAIGTRFCLTVDGPSGERELHRYVSSGGSFGGSSLLQEVGLGDAERIVKLRIDWVGGQQGQEFLDLPMRTRITITEKQAEFSVETLEPTRWPSNE